MVYVALEQSSYTVQGDSGSITICILLSGETERDVYVPLEAGPGSGSGSEVYSGSGGKPVFLSCAGVLIRCTSFTAPQGQFDFVIIRPGVNKGCLNYTILNDTDGKEILLMDTDIPGVELMEPTSATISIVDDISK